MSQQDRVLKQRDDALLSPLLDALGRHRATLVAVYLALFGLYLLSVQVFLAFAGTEGLRILIPGQEPWAGGDEGNLLVTCAVLVVFLTCQALFLWGGGKVTLAKKPAGIWRLLVPVALGTGMLMAVGYSFLLAVLEMFDRLNSQGSLRGPLLSLLSLRDVFRSGLAPTLMASWVVWLIVGLLLLRNLDRNGALARLTVALLAGSWIEFLVALPVDIAIRQRAEQCPCSTGSWIALSVSVPVFLFAFGPGVYLLYLRELRLGRTQPHRLRRILLRKTRLAPRVRDE